MKQQEKSRYFQEITRFFLNERGAPFFLSPTDLDLISQWEKMEIPLKIVLEGLEQAFENNRSKPGRKRKIHSLAFCKFFVLKASEQFKERQIGTQNRRIDREKKRKRIKNEIQNFLNVLTPELAYLEEVFREAKKTLYRKDVDEKNLEQFDERIEKLLMRHCSNQDKTKLKKEIQKEYPSAKEDELQSFSKIKLIKYMRDKNKIPYVSFYYY